MGESKAATAGPVEGDILALLVERMKQIARSEAVAVLEERRIADPAEDDKGITAKEAARLLGVSEWRVYEMIKRKVLPAYRPSPQRLRLRLGDVRAFIRQQKP
jgi:excisionase family DNA binding protein